VCIMIHQWGHLGPTNTWVHLPILVSLIKMYYLHDV
jgi:hypothetical protein